MSKFNTDHIINVFSQLGNKLKQPEGQLAALIGSEHLYNPWFTPANVENSLKAIGEALNEADLRSWLNNYPELGTERLAKQVGLILAGNIPMVGFHDVLCVLLSGHKALIKSSTQDARLVKQVLELLVEIEPAYADSYTFVERLRDFDAVIATGSNNSSRYFEFYFGKVPNIIRKNRNSVALLTGQETPGQLNLLGKDIFDYFGLGCRNVSKLLVPKGYDFVPFFESIESYQPIADHYKYHNNYDYNKSIMLINGDKHLDNGFLLVKEDVALTSPLAVVNYQEYDNLAHAEEILANESENIQCVVADAGVEVFNQTVAFGQSQRPALWDYADGADTLKFLVSIS